MCGIVGAWGPADRSELTRTEVVQMTSMLRRRGPDGQGIHAVGGMVFGHARLAIIDLVTGDQPVSNADGSIVATVNGEIYNYIELRAHLAERGYKFKTSGDIEVIPLLYEEYGDAFVDHLRGMFAIALWDDRKHRLVLVRDRLGKKPLYWTEHQGVLYFASELKAILELDLPLSIDMRAIEEFFTYQYVPAPRSIFREVNKLVAGSRLICQGSTRRSEVWWSPPAAPDYSWNEEDALERLGAELDDAVRLRLRSDVPLGAFLSGGIDSTLVVATAAGLLDRPLKTTTIDFAGADEGEVNTARMVASRFGTDHSVKHIDADIEDIFLRVGAYLDEPLGDSSTIPTWLVSRAAREDVTVVLSGDGGDESFGGYSWRYYQNLLIDRIRGRLPRLGRRMVGGMARVYPKADRWPKPLRLKWGLHNLSVSAEDAYFLDMSILRPEDKERLYRSEFRQGLDGFEARDGFIELMNSCPSDDLLTRLLWVDMKTYLAEGVLAKVDRMSMACSLEVRAPLLDHRIVELATSLPPDLKMKGRRSKYLLRRLAEMRVGSDVANAPKVGFAPPLGAWLRGPLKRLFEETVLEGSQGCHIVLDPGEIRLMWDEHISGQRDHARPLWLALVFEEWYRQFGHRARFT